MKKRTIEESFWSQLGWRVANGAALAVVAAAVMLPWAIRNQRVFGKPILTTTHGGYTLLLGNNAEFFAYLADESTGLPWNPSHDFPDGLIASVATPDYMHILDQLSPGPDAELVWDEAYHVRARHDVRSQPLSFLHAGLYRVRQLWSPLPYKLSADESTKRMLLRYATAAWYCGVYLLAAVGVWRLRWQLVRPSWVWGMLLCLTFTAVHTLYWCNLRMRAPLMPFVAIVAGAGLACLSPAERRTKPCGEVLNKA